MAEAKPRDVARAYRSLTELETALVALERLLPSEFLPDPLPGRTLPDLDAELSALSVLSVADIPQPSPVPSVPTPAPLLLPPTLVQQGAVAVAVAVATPQPEALPELPVLEASSSIASAALSEHRAPPEPLEPASVEPPVMDLDVDMGDDLGGGLDLVTAAPISVPPKALPVAPAPEPLHAMEPLPITLEDLLDEAEAVELDSGELEDVRGTEDPEESDAVHGHGFDGGHHRPPQLPPQLPPRLPAAARPPLPPFESLADDKALRR